MSLKVYFVDLRNRISVYRKAALEWYPHLTAEEAVREAFGNELAQQAVADLQQNRPEILVAWDNPTTEEHSEVGGVGSHDWQIPDTSNLTIIYEDQDTTNQQIDESSDWMLENE
jgi:hypothetical protein